MTKTQKITYYVLLVLVSAGFLMAAIPKITGQEMSIQGFAAVGLPVWFMYVIGILEILGAIGLWIRKLSWYAALGLFIILAGAFGTTIAFVSAPLSLIPVVYAVVLAIVVWLDKKRGATQVMPV